jgi:hypothetical protein
LPTHTLSPQRSTLFTGTPLGYTEGAHIYRRDGYYYLLVAEGGTSYEHAVVVLRAKDITGPYELHPDVTMMTSWHLPENPLQKRPRLAAGDPYRRMVYGVSDQPAAASAGHSTAGGWRARILPARARDGDNPHRMA